MRWNLGHFALLALALATGCVVESSRPPVTAGDGVRIDGDSQVSLDPARVPVVAGDCPAGTVLKRTADGWACAELGDATTSLPALEGCAEGQVVARRGEAWKCIDRVDAATQPVVASCPPGQFVKRALSGWTCDLAVDPERTPVVEACSSGEVVRRTVSGWECAAAVDAAQTPIVAACAAGEFVQRTSAGWTCAPALNALTTPVVSGCSPGQVVSKTADGWTCIAATDPSRTPVIEACGAGLYVQRTATGWQCSTLAGDLLGNVTGNLRGNVTGNLTGNVTGNVTGNLVGDVEGDLVGNVTGSVSGTAANVTGVVAIAHGGTGVTSLPGNALAMLNPAGDAFAGLAPGPAGTVLGSDGTSWRAVSVSGGAGGGSSRTKQDMSLYVRVDGSDTLCNGSANAAASAAPACAFSSPQRAIDAIPEVLEHNVTVAIGAGTYHAPSSGGVLVDVAKIGKRGAYLKITGSGSVTLSGALATTPTTAAAAYGISAPRMLELRLENLTLQRFTANALLIAGATVTASGVTIQNVGGAGVFADAGGILAFSGTNTISNCGTGVYAVGASRVANSGNLTVDALSATGINVEHSSAFQNAGGTLVVTNAATHGLVALRGGYIHLLGSTRLSGHGSHPIVIQEHSTFVAAGALDVTVSVNSAIGVVAQFGSYALINAGVPVLFSCTGSGNTGLYSAYQSTVAFYGASTVTITNCARGLGAAFQATVTDWGSGTRTINGAATAARIDHLSSYVRGGFPKADGANCANGSVCP